jgi:Skp family chaperone for outer membrane proteins
MEFSLIKDGPASYVARIKAPPATGRISAHYVLLIDNSGSMETDRKLENVKKCIGGMLDCLTADDYISIITFESHSVVWAKAVQLTAANKEYVASILEKIHPLNMTNLSAGLGNVQAVIQAGPAVKTGVLLLTDGNVNVGIKDQAQLKTIIRGIQDNCPGLTIQCVGYGTDHNAAFLKEVAVETSGSYNIVNTIEDVGTAYGDALGGIMSCVAQNVEVVLPEGAVVHGPYKSDITGAVHIGDIYADTEKYIIFECSNANVTATLNAMLLPNLTPYSATKQATHATERSIDIELCRHRYTCAAILQQIANHKPEEKNAIRAKIEAFKAAIQDTAYNGNSHAAQLRAEVVVLEETLESQSQEDAAVINQHISYYGLGRGFTSPLSRNRESTEEDPQNRSLFQNTTQRNISNTLSSIRLR